MADRRLLEDGSSYRLLEDGSSKRLLESDGTVEVGLTSGASWVLPADADVTKPLLGKARAPGGGGAHGKAGVGSGGGGGGGAEAIAEIDISGLTPGSSVIYLGFGTPGTGGGSDGADGTDGGDVWFNKAANSAPSSAANGVVAKGGKGGVSKTSGPASATFLITSTAEDGFSDAASYGNNGVVNGTDYAGAGGHRWLGLRFQTAGISQGAPITSAILRLTANAPFGGATATPGRVYVDKVANAPAWSSSSRPDQISKTTAYTALQGSAVDGTILDHNVTTSLQEVVDLSTFALNNYVRFGGDLTGATGWAIYYDYAVDPTQAAKLIVTWSADFVGVGGLGGSALGSIGTWKWSGSAGGDGGASAAGGKGGAAARYGSDPDAGDGGAGGTAPNGAGSDGNDYGAGGGAGAENGDGGDGAPGKIRFRYHVASGPPPGPTYNSAFLAFF